ncbi:uroporphyrinogen-III synthase [Methanosarcinaceae archaeon]|nr:uroporphyrinogen-III synthase [Methanosarcinaceae archaeon]
MGRPVLAIMRPEGYTDSSEKIAEEIGFIPYSVPVVRLAGMKDDGFDAFADRVMNGRSDYVIFTSANGLDYTLRNVGEENEKKFLDALKKTKIIAIGPNTEKRLEKEGLKTENMPGEYSSAGLVKALSEKVSRKVIDIPRSFYGSDDLPNGLRKAGAEVYETHVYTLEIPEDGEAEELIEKTINGEIQAFAFTSSMMVRNFMKIAENLGEDVNVRAALSEAVVGAIGIPTADTIESFGIRVDVVPENFTFEELLKAIRSRF